MKMLCTSGLFLIQSKITFVYFILPESTERFWIIERSQIHKRLSIVCISIFNIVVISENGQITDNAYEWDIRSIFLQLNRKNMLDFLRTWNLPNSAAVINWIITYTLRSDNWFRSNLRWFRQKQYKQILYLEWPINPFLTKL